MSVTLIDLPFALAMASAQDLFESLAALRCNFIRRRHGGQRMHRGAHDIDGIARAVALGEHVANASAFEHRPHAASGYETRSVGGGLHVNPSRPMTAVRGVVQRRVVERDIRE